MSIKVNYKGAEILSYGENGTKTLKTSGKYCEGDISITNTQDGGITPTGTIEITENGTYDVTEKASAVVNVASSGDAKGLIWTEVDADGYPTKVVARGLKTLIRVLYSGRHATSGNFQKLEYADLSNTLPNGSDPSYDMAFIAYNVPKLKTVIMPSWITYIGNEAFKGCSGLETLVFSNSITYFGLSCFEQCTRFRNDRLPTSLQTVDQKAFNLTPLHITEMPSSVQKIDNYAFAQNAEMTTLTFKGTPTSISATAFYNNTNLTTIKVPWAEGAVANAPWGATNATITYNYTGE